MVRTSNSNGSTRGGRGPSSSSSSSSNLGDLKNWELYQFTAAFQDPNFLLQVNNLDGKDYFVEHFTNRVVKHCISQDHKKKCGDKFDINSFLYRMASDCFDATVAKAAKGGRATAHVPTSANEEDSMKLITVGGRTQSGKTAIKALGIIMAKQMGYPSVVMTKGLKECSETLQKFQGLFSYAHAVVPYTSTFDKTSKAQKMKLIQKVLSEGGTLLIIDNFSQVGIAHDILRKLMEASTIQSFVFMVDEADSAYRTEDRKQCFEQAYDKLLRDMRPIMTFMVSATPLTYLLEVAKVKTNSNHSTASIPWDENFAFFDIPTSPEDYVGLDMMKVLQDPITKTKVYLEEGEIRRSEIYHHPKYDMLYEDAIKAASTKTGILLLDTSVPWVEAKSNVYEKAELILQRYPSVCIITYTGTGGICVKGPLRDDVSSSRVQSAGKGGRSRGRKVEDGWRTIPEDHNTTIGSVIDTIPLHVPVFLLGYHKAIRCISFRGDYRVPTHVGISLGKGHGLSNLVQAIGRATGNNKSVLTANGHDHVTILVNKEDFTSVIKHENFVSEFGKLMSVNNKTTKGKGGNMNAKDALVHALACHDDNLNFLRHTKREIGKLKGQRQRMKRIQSS